MFLVFRRVYKASVPDSRMALWHPLANLVVDVILLQSIRMCLTGNVTWRGTNYGITAAQTAKATQTTRASENAGQNVARALAPNGEATPEEDIS
jgi:hypothetical protein